MTTITNYRYQAVIDGICDLDWSDIGADNMTSVAWAYYYFSIQFRENLRAARSLYPLDAKLVQLEAEECDTANLSPWLGIAATDEAMNHDEFMRRTLGLTPIEATRSQRFEIIGRRYLTEIRALDLTVRAASIASYENGGLERVFKAILRFSDWETPLLRAFRHFLAEHVRFDSDLEQGHGALSRHIEVDDRILPLWEGFRDLLVNCVPALRKTDTVARLHELGDGDKAPPLGVERVVAYASVHEVSTPVAAHDDPVCRP